MKSATYVASSRSVLETAQRYAAGNVNLLPGTVFFETKCVISASRGPYYIGNKFVQSSPCIRGELAFLGHETEIKDIARNHLAYRRHQSLE